MKAVIYWQHPAATKLAYSKMASEKQPVVLDFTRPLQISGFAKLSTLLKSEPRCLLLQSDAMVLCSMDTMIHKNIHGIYLIEACNKLKTLNLDFGKIKLKEKRSKYMNISNYNPIPIEIKKL